MATTATITAVTAAPSGYSVTVTVTDGVHTFVYSFGIPHGTMTQAQAQAFVQAEKANLVTLFNETVAAQALVGVIL